MTGLHYPYDLSRGSLVHKSVSRYGLPNHERTGRCEGTGSPRARRDVVNSEVVVVAEKALAVPVAQDQFDRDAGRGHGGFKGGRGGFQGP